MTSTAALVSALNEASPEGPSCLRKLNLGHPEDKKALLYAALRRQEAL
jgi:hypothetical protein